MNKRNTQSLYYEVIRNPYCLIFIFTFLGFLSLSFLGIENKAIRILSTCACFSLAIFPLYKAPNYLYNDSIIKNFLFFIVLCFPSILFTTDIFSCAFKLLELCLIMVFIILGIRFFKIITNKINVFELTLLYFVLQTIITIIGYFIDPKAIAIDNGNGVYVTFLRCNYPPLHSNGLSTFGVISGYYCVTKIIIAYKIHSKANLLLYIALGLISFLMVYLTSSRTGIFSGLIGLIFLCKMTLNKYQKTIITILFTASIIIFSQQYIDSISKILMKRQDQTTLAQSNNIADAISSGRISIWTSILSNPVDCIFGKGFGTAVKEENIASGSNAHNSLVELFISVGIFASILWIRNWYLLFKRYQWLCKHKKFLPYNIIWYHLAASILIVSVARSLGNLSFVYFDLASFAPIAVIALFVYSTIYVRKKRKIILKCPSPNDFQITY